MNKNKITFKIMVESKTVEFAGVNKRERLIETCNKGESYS